MRDDLAPPWAVVDQKKLGHIWLNIYIFWTTFCYVSLNVKKVQKFSENYLQNLFFWLAFLQYFAVFIFSPTITETTLYRFYCCKFKVANIVANCCKNTDINACKKSLYSWKSKKTFQNRFMSKILPWQDKLFQNLCWNLELS